MDGLVPVLCPVAWHLPVRCNEVCLAFYPNAFDNLRVDHLPSRSLAWPSRVRIALNN